MERSKQSTIAPPQVAFLYSDKFGDFSYGSGHPMRPERLRLTYELINHLGLLEEGERVEARPATDAEILTAHSEKYLRILKEADCGRVPSEGSGYGLGFGDNPVFKGLYEWSSYSAGASVQAAELVASGEVDAAFNICGGLHHAMKEDASGFCYINDAVVAINSLLKLGKRVAYVDIDAHHGDGVERAFYDSDKVLTISLHESGDYLFPGTGFSRDRGSGAGLGYAVNLPLPPETGDTLFFSAFKEVVPPFIEAFRPDVLVTQLGVDTMKTDPITHLRLTTKGFEAMVKTFKDMGLPWVALGGGGYDLSNVARCWTLAWAAICDRQVPDELSEGFASEILGQSLLRLRDKPGGERVLPQHEEYVNQAIESVKSASLPLVSVR